MDVFIFIGINSEDMICSIINKSEIDDVDPDEEMETCDLIDICTSKKNFDTFTEMHEYINNNKLNIFDEIQYVLY